MGRGSRKSVVVRQRGPVQATCGGAKPDSQKASGLPSFQEGEPSRFDSAVIESTALCHLQGCVCVCVCVCVCLMFLHERKKQ